jgi:GntR family transcriptional regulator
MNRDAMVDPLSMTPVYVQIADIIAARIKAGELKPGRPIPSETQLVQEFQVARNTARAAVAELRRRDLVVTVPHRGSYVNPALPAE